MLKKAAQQGRSERKAETYSPRYVEVLSDARTKLEAFFNILLVSMRFIDNEKTTVRNAVQAAERRTRGEIVPLILPASARYRESSYLAGLVAALL